MKVRADGNNFIPEVAAISCMIKALPPDISMTLRSDSLAAIGAISKGRVSERRRVRAPGRPWLNFCREDLLQKRASINLEHVSSHKGLQSPEQIGNDLADKLANCFRTLGEGIPPVKYFMSAEEPFVLVHNGKVVQGDPRPYLKKVSCEKMMTIVRETSKKQSEWLTRYPKQILSQVQRVWKWCIEVGDGQAWIYFIFAVCQWLPTNHRLYYESKSAQGPNKCHFCLLHATEDMMHMWSCPAFAKERENLRIAVNAALVRWDLPFAEKPVLKNETKMCMTLTPKQVRCAILYLKKVYLEWLTDFGKFTLRNPRFRIASFCEAFERSLRLSEIRHSPQKHSTPLSQIS